jgi:membrane-bound lytic murein transglycosylase B
MTVPAHRLLCALCCGALLLGAAEAKRQKTAAPSAAAAYVYAGRAEVREFAAAVAARRAIDADWVEARLALARRQETAQRLMMPPPPGSAKNWAAYRDRFIEPRRIAAGVAFWQDNAAWLQRAEQRYGVPAQIIVGIVGVETFYGRVTGSFRVLDVLATLAFDFPSGRSDRSPFFREQLEEFLVLCWREELEPASIKGSYAGAIGWPQFMPGSINRFAVDFDDDGAVDLQSDGADVVGSVANYLAEHGWQRGMPAYYAVSAPLPSAQRATLLLPDILPSFSAAQMLEQGAALDEAGRAHSGPLALVELQNGAAAPSYVAGTQNFYALTRYNASSYYAMAVIGLGEAVKRAR